MSDAAATSTRNAPDTNRTGKPPGEFQLAALRKINERHHPIAVPRHEPRHQPRSRAQPVTVPQFRSAVRLPSRGALPPKSQAAGFRIGRDSYQHPRQSARSFSGTAAHASSLPNQGRPLTTRCARRSPIVSDRAREIGPGPAYRIPPCSLAPEGDRTESPAHHSGPAPDGARPWRSGSPAPTFRYWGSRRHGRAAAPSMEEIEHGHSRHHQLAAQCGQQCSQPRKQCVEPVTTFRRSGSGPPR